MMKQEDVTFDKIKESTSLEELNNFKMQLAEHICDIRIQLLNKDYYSYQDEVYGKVPDENTQLENKYEVHKRKVALEKKLAQKEMVDARIDNMKHLSEVAESMTE